jgi:MazG family protein
MSDNNNRVTTQCLRLVSIMETLRSPDGCPWDKKQSASSLKPYLLEETYELLEAIDTGDVDDIRDELGDLLLQIIFMSQIYAEDNLFNIADVAEAISDKLIRRHPHVFADADKDDHAQQWEKAKRQERAERGKNNRLSDRIPKGLPALKQATKVAKKTTTRPVDNLIEKAIVELNLLKQQVKQKSHGEAAAIEDSLGNLLYTLVEMSTSIYLDAEDILRQKTIKVMATADE